MIMTAYESYPVSDITARTLFGRNFIYDHHEEISFYYGLTISFCFSYFLYTLLKQSTGNRNANPTHKSEVKHFFHALKVKFDMKADCKELTKLTVE